MLENDKEFLEKYISEGIEARRSIEVSAVMTVSEILSIDLKKVGNSLRSGMGDRQRTRNILQPNFLADS